MTRFDIDNRGGSSTVTTEYTLPVPKEDVRLPDDLPERATVELTEDDGETTVTIQYPVPDSKKDDLLAAMDSEGAVEQKQIGTLEYPHFDESEPSADSLRVTGVVTSPGHDESIEFPASEEDSER